MAKINLQVLNQRTKGPIRPPSAIRRRQLKRWRLGVLAIIFLFLLIIAGAVLAFGPFLKINRVVVTGTQVVDPQAAGQLAGEILDRPVFLIFPRNHLAWYPAEELTRVLREEFPRILEVKFAADFNHVLTIEVKERTPLLLLCAGGQTDCYLVDETGLAYTRAPFFSPGVFLKWQASTSNQTAPFRAGEAATVKRLLDAQVLFERALEQVWGRRFRLTSVDSLPDGDYAFTVSPRYRAASSSDWRVLVDGERSPVTLATNLLTALSVIAAGPAATTTLEYVDLRFGEKVFYK